MSYLAIIFLLLLSYLFGSFPSGYVLAKKFKNIDIRNQGSKSTGATNTTRVLGIKFGIIALLLDAFKGIIIMFVLSVFKLESLFIVGKINILALYGVFAVIGHVFPIFLSFRGGKAVATSFGVVLFLNWWLAVIGALILISVVLITKYVSLGSMITALMIFIIALIAAINKITIFNSPVLLEYVIAYGILTIMIILKHQQNIIRLVKGTESKLSLKR